MEIHIVRNLLKDIALDHSKNKPDKAIQNIALALMHMAEAIHQLESDVASLTVSS